MADSTYVFERGDPIDVGTHGEHSYVFESGSPVRDGGGSQFLKESGTGLGGGTPGTMYIQSDNFHDMYINGELVHDGTSGSANDNGGVQTFQTTIPAGENIIAIVAYNSNGTDGPYGGFTHNTTGAYVIFSFEDGDGNVILESGRTPVNSYKVLDAGAGRDTEDGPTGSWQDLNYDDSTWGDGVFTSGGPGSTVGNLPGDPLKAWNSVDGAVNTEHVHEVYHRYVFTI